MAFSSRASALSDAPKVLKYKPDGIDAARRNIDIRGVGTMPVRVHEQPVPSRRKGTKRESAHAVGNRRSVSGARIVPGRYCHYRVVRQRSSCISERSDDTTK